MGLEKGLVMNKHPKMLVVDDDWTNRKIISETIKSFANPDEANDGKVALEMFRYALEAGEKYDIVLLDIMMPDINGIEVVKRIREIETNKNILGLCGVKIIMCTSAGDSCSVMGSFTKGCEAYLVKPISKQALFEEIENLGFSMSTLVV